VKTGGEPKKIIPFGIKLYTESGTGFNGVKKEGETSRQTWETGTKSSKKNKTIKTEKGRTKKRNETQDKKL